VNKTDFDRFADKFEDLARYFKAQKTETDFDLVRESERYWKYLRPYTIDSVIQAMEVIEAYNKFWPKVSDILKVIEGGRVAAEKIKPNRVEMTYEEKQEMVRLMQEFTKRYPGLGIALWGRPQSDDGMEQFCGFTTTKCLDLGEIDNGCFE